MAISPLMLNGSIMSSQDISMYKTGDDNKAALVQSTTVQTTDKENQEQSTRVNQTANAAENGEGFDASSQGGSEYAGDGGANRKKKLADKDGRVIIKNKGGFNVSV
ncbi:MAG: hypothetical protein K6F99_10680 [Lachnospiraceae bacterium]|nr:hypothetical protein [Lachnospiraceae bacterium]